MSEFDDAFAAAVKRGRSDAFLLERWREERLEAWGQLLEAHVGWGDGEVSALDDVDWSRDESFAQARTLLRTLEGSPLKKLFAHLVQQPGDPRFASMLSEFYGRRRKLLEAPMMMGAFSSALMPHADSRHIQLLKRVADTSVKARKQSEKALAGLRDETPDWLAARLAKMPKLVRDRSHEDALWSAVYAKDFNARRVLADALMERGDARGEFIANQLAGDTTAPTGTLLRSLLGPLFSALRPDTVEFENGFPVSGLMSGKLTGRKQSAAFMLREWSTLKSLKYVERLGPGLTSLERVDSISTVALDEWIKERWPIPLRALSSIHQDSMSRIGKLPSPIEHFDVLLWLQNEAAFDAALQPLEDAHSLTSLRITAAYFQAPNTTRWSGYPTWPWPQWSDRVLAMPNLRTLDLPSAEGRWVFTSKTERFDTLTLHRHGPTSSEFEARAPTVGSPTKFFSVHADDLA